MLNFVQICWSVQFVAQFKTNAYINELRLFFQLLWDSTPTFPSSPEDISLSHMVNIGPFYIEGCNKFGRNIITCGKNTNRAVQVIKIAIYIIAFRATLSIGTPEIDEITYKSIPTGGVTTPIVKQIVMKTPKYIR